VTRSAEGIVSAMSSLELKIPPPAVALLVAVAMWGLARVTSAADAPAFRVAAALAIAAVGVAFSIAAVVAFRRAKTSKNPMRPEVASSLVVTGVYKLTRNPMYLGLSFALLAWAVFLWSAWAVLGPVVFIAYIARFQIAPEERVLATLFGAEYASYKTRVRRWL
jgi:protein-S-isoprenylcysteine O-methyltransferase Ste14